MQIVQWIIVLGNQFWVFLWTQTGTYTTISIASISLYTGTKKIVQIQPGAFYPCTNLATAINNLNTAYPLKNVVWKYKKIDEKECFTVKNLQKVGYIKYFSI